MDLLDPDFFVFTANSVWRAHVMGMVRAKISALNTAGLAQGRAQELRA
ncbi:MAG: hypothetical protein JO137_16035 [Hyphomicrobiales bacterium]|nr:hypothetical protein [Hyphomicrobiales bacterium]MBV9433332.1 hypothetical protein [Hyphomicrobiales bacterium]